MPPVLENGSDSDSEDIFTMGDSRPVSIYSARSRIHAGDISSSEDEALPQSSTPAPVQRKRGRPGKRGRGGRAGSVRAPVETASPPKPKKVKTSVFDISSGDEDDVREATPLDDMPRRDSMDEAAERQLANARRVLESASTNRIQAEAQIEAERDMRGLEMKREEEKRRKAEKAKDADAEIKRIAALSSAKPILLKVRCADKATMVKIRRTDPILKILPHFCKKFGLDVQLARMLFDGEDVTDEDTPDRLELEDKMVIDVVLRKSQGT